MNGNNKKYFRMNKLHTYYKKIVIIRNFLFFIFVTTINHLIVQWTRLISCNFFLCVFIRIRQTISYKKYNKHLKNPIKNHLNYDHHHHYHRQHLLSYLNFGHYEFFSPFLIIVIISNKNNNNNKTDSLNSVSFYSV